MIHKIVDLGFLTEQFDETKIPEIRTVTLSPEQCEYILQYHNELNRPFNKNYAGKIAGMMKNGEWQTTGETISFTKNWKLLNGQHRLYGCFLSGKSQKFNVAWGIPEDSFLVIDVHRRRSGSDMIYIASNEITPKDARLFSGVLDWLEKIRGVKSDKGSFGILDNKQKLEIWDKYKDRLIELHGWWVDRHLPMSLKKIPFSLRLAVQYITVLNYPEISKDFWEDFTKEISENPICVLAKDKISYLMNYGKLHDNTWGMLKVILVAFQAFIGKSTMKTSHGFSMAYNKFVLKDFLSTLVID